MYRPRFCLQISKHKLFMLFRKLFRHQVDPQTTKKHCTLLSFHANHKRGIHFCSYRSCKWTEVISSDNTTKVLIQLAADHFWLVHEEFIYLFYSNQELIRLRSPWTWAILMCQMASLYPQKSQKFFSFLYQCYYYNPHICCTFFHH